MNKILLLLSIVTFGVTTAQNIFQDDFATYTTGTNLSGQGTWSNNSSLPGGLGGCAGFGCLNSKVIATGIDYLNYGSSVNSAELKSDLDACGKGFTAVTTNDVYVAMVINLTGATTGTTDFFRVMSGGNFNPAFRMSAKNNGASFFIGFSKSSAATVYTTNSYAYGQNHLVVFKYSKFAGASDDTVTIYVDPNFSAGLPAVSDGQTFAGTDQTLAIDRLSIRQNAATGTFGRYGLVSVSSTWAGLAFPNLATNNFKTTNFNIVANNAKAGMLLINSNANFENAKVSIYDIQGKVIETKIVSLTENTNEITINSIQNSGVYIVEIIANDKQFTQKVSIN
jgi:Secretion system C-terminal sorting domain